MTPKISSLTPSDKIRLAAELDGYDISTYTPFQGGAWCERNGELIFTESFDKYQTSYDAIIPLIQKQPIDVKYKIYHTLATMLKEAQWLVMWDYTPSQLLDALLVATGKAVI